MSDFDDKIRYGGPQGDEGGDDAARKAEERERKKAEVRKRLEEQGKAGKKAKKGFLTPERKKKLRKLLMMKAAEDLKQQQLLKEQERQKVLAQRIIPMPNIDGTDDTGALCKIYNDLFERVKKLEEEKYDINFTVSSKDAEINELTIAVNDLRGKFVKPSLKKVSKYDNKFKKMADATKTEGKADFRANLKVVKKENAIEEIMTKKAKSDKPDWSKKSAEGEKVKDGEPKEEAKEEAAPAEEAPVEEPVVEEEEGEEEEEDEEEEEE